MLTPKQVHFLGRLSLRLKEEGHEVLNTTRLYREANQLLKLLGFKAEVFGKHGGGTLEGKLLASTQRINELTPVIAIERPDIAISFSSPESARTSFGLGIPHYSINDSPHAIAVALLTLPLSKKLFAPKVIPKEKWIQVGVKEEKIIQYNALDPIVWIKNFKPDPAILDELNLDVKKPIVVFRTEESFAAYLLGRTSQESVIIPIIKKLQKQYKDQVQVIILPRYEEQISVINTIFGDCVITLEKVVDGPNLLSFTSVFIGAGGTMTAEAALLGIPAISCYPREPTIVEEFLINENVVQRSTNPNIICSKIVDILNNFDKVRSDKMEKANKLIKNMEDPFDIISENLEVKD